MRDIQHTHIRSSVLNTHVEMMDVTPLRDEDAVTPGFYAAVCPVNQGLRAWRGAALVRSRDGGQMFREFVALFTKASAIGMVVSQGEGALIVQMLNAEPELLSATPDAVENGANLAVLGDQVIQYTTVSLVAPKTYLLSGLVSDARDKNLRGSRGVTAQTGTRFVPFSDAWRRITLDEALIGKSFYYIAQSSGQPLSVTRRKMLTCNCGWWKIAG